MERDSDSSKVSAHYSHPSNPTPPLMEPLEERRMLSALPYTINRHHTLIVQGSRHGTTLAVTTSGRHGKFLDVTINGKMFQFPSSSIRRVVFEEHSGHDKIRVQRHMYTPCEILGYDGSDYLVGDSGDTGDSGLTPPSDPGTSPPIDTGGNNTGGASTGGGNANGGGAPSGGNESGNGASGAGSSGAGDSGAGSSDAGGGFDGSDGSDFAIIHGGMPSTSEIVTFAATAASGRFMA